MVTDRIGIPHQDKGPFIIVVVHNDDDVVPIQALETEEYVLCMLSSQSTNQARARWKQFPVHN